MLLSKSRMILMSLSVLILSISSCASKQVDRCYVTPSDYETARALFLDTQSMKRVEQLMENEGWRSCEKEQVRYQLAKDFHLEELYVDLE